MHDLHSIRLKFADILSTSFDNEIDINLKQSVNLSLYATFILLSHSFLTGTEKVIYFPYFLQYN